MITVQFAVELQKDNALQRYAPPPRFPMVVDETTQKVIEPVFAYLDEKFLKRQGRKWKSHSANAAAYDLRSWFDFLENVENADGTIGKAWDIASEKDYADFREALQDVISEITHRPLESSTIRRRQYAVEDFYAFAKRQQLYLGDLLTSTIIKGRYRPADYMPLVHIQSGERQHVYSKYREEIGSSGLVRPLTATEWALLKSSLGNLPSEREQGDNRPSRDRLASELSCTTGLRVDEIANLTLNDCLNLDAQWRLLDDEAKEEGYVPLFITKTKRLVPRTVLIPAYLVPELTAYLEVERKAAVKAGKAYAKSKGQHFQETRTLFLNHANAGRNAGKPARPASLSKAFHDACMECGLVTIVTKTDPATGEEYDEKIASHSFHDLRHTFSVWRYERDKSRSEEPWKPLQVLLGHASLQTTMDIYLSVTEINKIYVGATVFRAKQQIGGQDA